MATVVANRREADEALASNADCSHTDRRIAKLGPDGCRRFRWCPPKEVPGVVEGDGIIVDCQIGWPARLSSSARKLEDRESPMKPVRGDLAATANFAEVVTLLPTNGLVAKMSGFSGPSGSALRGHS